MITLAQLIAGITPDEMEQDLLNTLQGVSPVSQNGSNGGPIVGTGVVTAVGPATAAAAVIVKITTTGQAGAAAFQYSLDGGLTFNPASPVTVPTSGVYFLPTINVSLTFANGATAPTPPLGTTGSFQAGETYSFNTSTPTFPVSNWSIGSAPLTLLKMEANELSDLTAVVGQLAAAGLVMSWITPPLVNGVPTPPPDGWLDLLAASVYAPTGGRSRATRAQGLVVLACAPGAGPYTLQAGQQFVGTNTRGLTYYTVGFMVSGSFVTTATLAAGGTLIAVVVANQPGSAYSLVQTMMTNPPPSGQVVVNQMLTPLAGVTVTNPLVPSPPVSHAGTGGGTLVLSGTPTNKFDFVFDVVTAGGTGVGVLSWSMNGGQTQQGTFTAGSSIALGSTGMSVACSGSFVFGDTYAASTGWISVNGTDDETSLSLATRCLNLWATLGPGGPEGVYFNWAKAASPEVVSVEVFPDELVPGQVDVILAGAGGQPVSSGAVSAVQSYIDARVPEAVTASVQNVASLTITVGTSGTGSGIYVLTAQLAAAQAQIAAGLTALQLKVGSGGVVYFSAIEAIVQNAGGVRNVEGLTVNGGSVDIVLLANQSPLIVAPSSGSYVAI